MVPLEPTFFIEEDNTSLVDCYWHWQNRWFHHFGNIQTDKRHKDKTPFDAAFNGRKRTTYMHINSRLSRPKRITYYVSVCVSNVENHSQPIHDGCILELCTQCLSCSCTVTVTEP